MAQTVSNDALWEKLSEIDKALNGLTKVHKSSTLMPEQVRLKDEIIGSIKENIHILDLSNNSHFEENKKNVVIVNKNILLELKQITDIQERINTCIEQGLQGSNKASYFDFKLFKIKKTSIVITMLSILIFTLTLFCMKQQNDYSLLTEVCYKQGLYIDQIKTEVDSLRNVIKPNIKKKK